MDLALNSRLPMPHRLMQRSGKATLCLKSSQLLTSTVNVTLNKESALTASPAIILMLMQLVRKFQRTALQQTAKDNARAVCKALQLKKASVLKRYAINLCV